MEDKDSLSQALKEIEEETGLSKEKVKLSLHRKTTGSSWD